MVLENKELYPDAVLLDPVVIEFNAVVPIATLYGAVEIVNEGSFPMYNELFSTNTSDKLLNTVTAEELIASI